MWVEGYLKVGHVADLPGKGKKKTTVQKEDRAIRRLFEQDPTLRLRQAKKLLAKKEINVSITTIRQRLSEFNVKYRPTTIKPLLSEVHKEKCLAWGTNNINHDWSKVMFTDKATFWALSLSKHVWTAYIYVNYYYEKLNFPATFYV